MNKKDFNNLIQLLYDFMFVYDDMSDDFYKDFINVIGYIHHIRYLDLDLCGVDND